jgi:hypothetical protein
MQLPGQASRALRREPSGDALRPVLEPAECVDAHRFDEQGLGLDDRSGRPWVGERDVLWADAEDDLPSVRERRTGRVAVERIAWASMRATGPDARPIEPERKFIAGAPTKPATNKVAGRS